MPADIARMEDAVQIWRVAGWCVRAAAGLWLAALLAGIVAMAASCVFNAWRCRAGRLPEPPAATRNEAPAE